MHWIVQACYKRQIYSFSWCWHHNCISLKPWLKQLNINRKTFLVRVFSISGKLLVNSVQECLHINCALHPAACSCIQACTNFVDTNLFRVAWISKVYLLCYAHVIRKILRISFIRVALWDRILQPMNSIRLAFGDYKTLGSSFSLSI